MAQYEADLLDRIHALEYELYDKPGIDEYKRRQEAGEVFNRATPESRLYGARSTAAQLAELFLGIAARLEAMVTAMSLLLSMKCLSGNVDTKPSMATFGSRYTTCTP